MQPIKQEPIEHPPLHIKPEPTEYPNPSPYIKPEPIDDNPENPPPKRLKTEDSPSSSSKGKSIIKEEEQDLFTDNNNDNYNDDDDESLVDSCGICLLEHGMSLQGFIDSCQHYFCFVCIMEWAKVESRCPICKRRFSTIRRPPKDGVFLSERIVNVPVRDQVHFFNGNSTIGPPDLYSQVKCSVCSRSSDDELLLLCDLCDSAAHSYCVGLGATVPEGDWFCKDCTLSRDEHAKVETNTTYEDNNIDNENVVRFAQPDVSIRDIVRDSYIRVPRTSSSSVGPSVDQSEPVAELSNTQPAVDGANAPNARTLQRCLNVHARIKVLRENWSGYRGGSLNFSSQKHSNSNVAPNKDSYDTVKAWKMMDIAARTVGKKPGNKGLVNKNSKLTIKKDGPSSSYIGRLKMHDGIGTSRNNDDKCRFHTSEKNKHLQGNVKRNQNHVGREPPSSMKIIASAQPKSNHYDCQRVPRKESGRAISEVGSSNDQSSSSSSTTTDRCRSRKEINGIVKENKSIEKDHLSESNIKEYENAKTEIISLVKLSLKRISKDKKLEVNVFKEVARYATHSIMAACGIEQPRARFHSFERVVCNHHEKQKQPSSNLMPTSCRECFLGFVKDVVTTIALDKTKRRR